MHPCTMELEVIEEGEVEKKHTFCGSYERVSKTFYRSKTDSVDIALRQLDGAGDEEDEESHQFLIRYTGKTLLLLYNIQYEIKSLAI